MSVNEWMGAQEFKRLYERKMCPIIWVSGRCIGSGTSKQTWSAVVPVSAQATSQPSRACVDTALALAGEQHSSVSYDLADLALQSKFTAPHPVGRMLVIRMPY